MPSRMRHLDRSVRLYQTGSRRKPAIVKPAPKLAERIEIVPQPAPSMLARIGRAMARIFRAPRGR